MNNKQIKTKLKQVGLGNREIQKLLMCLRNHPPEEELKTIEDVLNYCSDYY